MERLPPRLTQEAVQDMVDQFKARYPGELLNQDSMPGTAYSASSTIASNQGRRSVGSPGSFAHLPSSAKTTWRREQQSPCTEAQIIACAFSTRHPKYPGSTRALLLHGWNASKLCFRNAWALCGAAHLHNLEALDETAREHCLSQPDAQLGLRSPTTAN